MQDEIFTITVPRDGGMVNLTVKPNSDVDQVIYEIYDEKLLCAVGINEEGEWEADREISSDFVSEIGKAIDEVER